jgi:hypothetical protein
MATPISGLIRATLPSHTIALFAGGPVDPLNEAADIKAAPVPRDGIANYARFVSLNQLSSPSSPTFNYPIIQYIVQSSSNVTHFDDSFSHHRLYHPHS